MKLLLAALLAIPLSATSLYFTFDGRQSTSGSTAIGEGRIGFADGLTNVGLSDLTNFSFTDTEQERGNPGEPISGVEDFSYGLPDLTSFSLQLSGTTPTSFLLETRSIDGSEGAQQDFRVQDVFLGILTSSLASTINFIPDPQLPASTPEPATISLFGLSALLVGFGAWRRFKR